MFSVLDAVPADEMAPPRCPVQCYSQGHKIAISSTLGESVLPAWAPVPDSFPPSGSFLSLSPRRLTFPVVVLKYLTKVI